MKRIHPLQLAVLVIEFLITFSWNLMMPLMNDDLTFASLPSVASLFHASFHDYFYWNGRFFGQIIARLLAFMPHIASSALNGLAFILLTYLMASISARTKRAVSAWRLVGVFAANIVFLPAFGETVLWRAGAGNYLWPTVFILLLVHCFIDALDGVTTRSSHAVIFVSAFGLGMLAGWSNENTGGAGVMVIIALLLMQKYTTDHPLALWQFVALIGQIIGFTLLLLAPGNRVRSRLMTHDSFLHRLISGIFEVCTSIQAYYIYLIIFTAILIVIAAFTWLPQRDVIISSLFLVAGCAAIVVLIFSPIERTEGRTWFGGIVFLILAMFTATAHHRAHVAGGIVVWVVTLAVSLFAIPQMLAGTIDLFYMSRAVQTRYTTIMTAQQNGKKNSCTPRILVHCEDQIC